jgi:TetR/AcrR family transcriptional regulator, cholesterol catabolism regulator
VSPSRDSKAGRNDDATPLAGVIAALTRAAERGELSGNELDWSVARLSGKVRPGNPRLEGVDRRDDILRAAVEIFRREGYHRATLEMIGNALFVTKAAVYHYFASKKEILDAICERASVANYEAVMNARAAGGDPDAKLRRMLDGFGRTCMTEPGFNVLMRHLDEVSAPVYASVRRRGKEIEAAFRDTVGEGVAAGAFEPPDPRITVFGMLGALNYMYAWFRPDGRLSPEEVREALITFVVDGVRGSAGRPPRQTA